MSYTQIAQLELLNALKSITSEADLNEFKDLVAHFFAAKAQKEIDALWDNGTKVTEETDLLGGKTYSGDDGRSYERTSDNTFREN